MVFSVFDKEGNNITDNYDWVITSEGNIRYRSYEDLIGIVGVYAKLYFGNGHFHIISDEEEI